jgi:hypothetical protein
MPKHNRTRKRLFKLFGRTSLKSVPATILRAGKEEHPLREKIHLRTQQLDARAKRGL